MKGKMQLVQQMMKDPSGFVDTKPVQALTLLLAQEEQQLQESVAALVDATDTDADVDVVDPEQRADRLRAGLKAMIQGDVPATWVRLNADVDRPEEAAKVAGLDEDEWREQRAEWADRWRDQDLEGTDDELAGAHVRSRHGVTLQDFEEIVVEWDADREKAALRELLAGPIEDAQAQIDAVTDAVQEG